MQHLPGTEGFASGRGFSVDRLFLLSPLGFATVCVGPAQYAILGNSGSVSYLDKQAGREGQRQGPRQSKDTKKGEVHLLAWRPRLLLGEELPSWDSGSSSQICGGSGLPFPVIIFGDVGEGEVGLGDGAQPWNPDAPSPNVL